MPKGTIYFEGQRGRGSESYGYRVEELPGVTIAVDSDLSRNELLRTARRYNGYRPIFRSIPSGLQTELKRNLKH